ncbi:hypothetical protein G9F72_022910 [Clostridium estertheticum]|uniref:hypothetical protein n=1 Tax=Clostridium estertheticum TaxID=238834 RepID=UPI001CD0B597|nr:hypothetical protein [Clostridium estertheticum]MBZ9689152.1 hypothetical protein [Clostridium estertheticum]
MLLLIFIIPLLIWFNIYLFKVYYKFIFNDKDDFQNSVKYTLTPDIFSLFKGDYFKDKFSEAKLSGLIFFCIITIVIEILIVKYLI